MLQPGQMEAQVVRLLASPFGHDCGSNKDRVFTVHASHGETETQVFKLHLLAHPLCQALTPFEQAH